MLLRHIRWICLLDLLTGGLAATAAPRLTTGTIDGAPFTIAHPATWNRHVLLYAHGLRPESAPLTADLDVTDHAWERLLEDGWIVAATGYRRNGLIVRDAIADLEALRDHVERTAGAPALVVLLGESMGGTIVTLLAERAPGRYHGAIAIGAALQIREERDPLVPSQAPRIPLLFLTNQSELAGPAAYVEAAAGAPVPPALWQVARDGHVNINQAERTRAIDGLIAWITTNEIERRRDATVAVAAPDSEVEINGDRARGAVHSITDGFGNVFLSFTPRDFAQLGIVRGADFTLEVHDRSWLVRYGSDFSDVPRGAWVAFPRAEGLILLAINFGNAAQAAGLQAGDTVVVRRK